MSLDNLDLTILMDMVERHAKCVVRENDGHEYIAQFFELFSKACANRAADYRTKPGQHREREKRAVV
jgi:hypothetical protein